MMAIGKGLLYLRRHDRKVTSVEAEFLVSNIWSNQVSLFTQNEGEDSEGWFGR
jgi:hypothetical protein